MIDLVAEKSERRYRALPIGIAESAELAAEVAEQLEELVELLHNLDLPVLTPEIVKVRCRQVKYLMGSGKASEIARLAQECEADLLVFDCALTPSQQRNWERLSGCRVIGREEVILNIFAERAQTKEAVLQVELARAKYYLPRLTGVWGHLSRQRGGSATNRGEGEAQIETDRRLLRSRIRQLETELAQVRNQRSTQRKSRLRRPVCTGAIVGYTNVGKSSLLNALSGSAVLAKDQLFATLDPVSRKIDLPGHQELVLTDTVGFIRNLPHNLVEAFKSTLEETVLSDFLLLVLDVSSPRIDEQWSTTCAVLKELGADEHRIQVVFNKCDRLDQERDAVLLARLHGLFPNAVYVSAATGEGIGELLMRLADLSSALRRVYAVLLPPERHDLAAFIRAKGELYDEDYTPDGRIKMVFALEEKFIHKYTDYLQ